ncbi:DUF6262 family protein [Streptomyces sp. NPDC094153]|uniref:DUF6262 family protein n=1 Tax=Streptomyces sp. NPDC094153 TaxID=3366058 RepID=UPI003817DFAC
MTVPAARTANALEARRRRTEAGLERVQATLEELLRKRQTITVAAVARHADVSRTFLYEHAEARSLIEEAVSRAAGRRVQDRQAAHEAIEASWRERALNAEEALKAAQDEILAQREQIGELLGQIRDLQTPWNEQDIVRITTENSTLTRRARRAEAEVKSLTGKLSAARDNVRFADKRIADLEAQLIEQERS